VRAVIRILLAEDQAMIGSGLRLILERQHDMAVVGEARNGQEAVAMTLSLEPAIVVLDIDMSDTSGLDTLERIKARIPWTRVVAISRTKNEQYLERALRGGASGYVLKHASADHLVRAVRTAARGGLAVDWFGSIEPADSHLPGGRCGLTLPAHSSLTEREREVLRLVAEGYSNVGIASHLGISRKTVDSHRMHLMDKLGLHRRVDLTHYALQHGYVIVA
jgi:two-component system response regulator NreC